MRITLGLATVAWKPSSNRSSRERTCGVPSADEPASTASGRDGAAGRRERQSATHRPAGGSRHAQ